MIYIQSAYIILRQEKKKGRGEKSEQIYSFTFKKQTNRIDRIDVEMISNQKYERK